MKLLDIFTDTERNALLTALCNAAGAKDPDDSKQIYDYLENTPKTSLVDEVVAELHRLGFEIARK